MNKRDTAAWSSARLVGSFVHHVTRQLEAARDLEEVIACIQLILQTFITGSLQGGCADDGAHVQSDLQQALHQYVASVGWPVIQQCFFEDQFPGWATSVLTGMCALMLMCQSSTAAWSLSACRPVYCCLT